MLSHLEATKKQLTEKRSRLEAQIEATTKLLAELRKSLENNKVTLENLKEDLAKKIEWCDAQSAEYLAGTAERERELDILNQLREHME